MTEPKHKVAICFFGLTRSLNYTMPSIKTNILKVLQDNNIAYDIYLHTYDLTHISNKRSEEQNCPLDTEEWKLLNPIAHKITNQATFDANFNWKVLKQQGDFWKDGFNSTRNAIRQLNSLKEVTSLWLDKPRYDSYIYLRPDLLYVNPIDIDDIINHISANNIIVIPRWGNYRGGLNDRIAYGSYDVMKIYGTRIDYIQQHYRRKLGAMKKPYHSERYLTLILNKFRFIIHKCNLMGIRIRANHKPNDMDYNMFSKYITLNAS